MRENANPPKIPNGLKVVASERDTKFHFLNGLQLRSVTPEIQCHSCVMVLRDIDKKSPLNPRPSIGLCLLQCHGSPRGPNHEFHAGADGSRGVSPELCRIESCHCFRVGSQRRAMQIEISLQRKSRSFLCWPPVRSVSSLRRTPSFDDSSPIIIRRQAN